MKRGHEEIGVYAQIRCKKATRGSRNVNLKWLTQAEAIALLRAANRKREREIQRFLRTNRERKAG